MCGMKARHIRNAPVRFVLRTLFHSSSVKSVTFLRTLMPALLIRMSTRAEAFYHRFFEGSHIVSRWRRRTRRRRARLGCAIRRRLARPALASARAISRPSPRLAPVITATATVEGSGSGIAIRACGVRFAGSSVIRRRPWVSSRSGNTCTCCIARRGARR